MELSCHACRMRQLINSLSLENLLRMLFGKAVAWDEDYAFLQGNGTGKPSASSAAEPRSR